MKKILSLIIITIISFITTSCIDTQTENNLLIKIEDDVLVWEAYDGAVEYNVYINNILTDTISNTTYDLKLKEGTYKIKINAKTNNSYTGFSNILEYYSDGSKYENKIDKLAKPNLKLSNGLLLWDKVNNAVEYEVYKNDQLLTTTKDYSFVITEVLGDKYFIIAKNDNIVSEKSNIIEIKEDNNSGTVNIFSINDTHGAVVTNSNVTGLDKVETIVNELETEGDLIKIANGDIFQGGYASNVTRGKIFIDVLNEMEFDCFVIGNHEFDWGLETISVFNDGDLSNGEADFPFLGANIVNKTTSTMPSWLDEYTIVENNGLKVGIIGVIGEGLTSSISAEFVENYKFLDPVPIVERLSSKLRTEELCDVVVVAIHDYDSSTNERFAALSGDSVVDAVLCAHTHQRIAESIKRNGEYDLPVIQSNTKNISVGRLDLMLKDGNVKGYVMAHYNPSLYSSSSNILDIVSTYQDIILEGEKVVGYTNSKLSKTRLGYLAADGIVEFTNSDFACLNTGGVRSTIDTGNITMEDIYEVFPFDNKLILVEMSGSNLKSFYNTAEGYLYFSNNLDINNISSTQTYTICVIDYVYNYYYYQKYFKNQKATYLDSYIRDAVIYQIEREY